jgi:hypothetical protein
VKTLIPRERQKDDLSPPCLSDYSSDDSGEESFRVALESMSLLIQVSWHQTTHVERKRLLEYADFITLSI